MKILFNTNQQNKYKTPSFNANLRFVDGTEQLLDKFVKAYEASPHALSVADEIKPFIFDGKGRLSARKILAGIVNEFQRVTQGIDSNVEIALDPSNLEAFRPYIAGFLGDTTAKTTSSFTPKVLMPELGNKNPKPFEWPVRILIENLKSIRHWDNDARVIKESPFKHFDMAA